MIPRIEKLLNLNNIILFLIVLCGAFLRFKGIGYEDFWIDEIKTFWYVSEGLNPITVVKRVATKIQGPLYYIIVHYWLYFVELNETTLRIPSAIFGILSIFSIYKLANLLYDKETGIYSAIILSFSHVHFYHSQEARTYTLTTLLTILSFYYFLKFLENKKKTNLAIYIVISVALIYSHYFAALIIVSQNLYILLESKNHKKGFNLTNWIKYQSLILFLLTPIIILFLKYQILTQDLGRGDTVSSASIINLFEYFSGSKMLLLIFTVLLVLPFSKYIFTYVKRYSNIKPNYTLDSHKILLIIWLLLPITTTLAVSYIYKPIYYQKYLLISSIAFYILIAISIKSLRHNYLKFFFVLLILVLSILQINKSYQISEKPRWKEISRFIDNNYNKQDLIIFYPGFAANQFNYYHKNGYLQKKPEFQFKIVNSSLQQIRIWEKGDKFSHKQHNIIFNKNREVIWFILRRSDSKSDYIINELSKEFRLITDKSFINNKKARLLVFSRKNEPLLYH